MAGALQGLSKSQFPTSMEVIWYVERGGTVSHVLAECQPRLWSTSQAHCCARGLATPQEGRTHLYKVGYTSPARGFRRDEKGRNQRRFDESEFTEAFL